MSSGTGVSAETRPRHRAARTAAALAFLGLAAVPAGAAAPDSTAPRVLGVDLVGARSFRPAELQRFLTTRPTRPWYRRRFDAETLQRDVRNLQLFYRNEGFLQACVWSEEPPVADGGRGVRPRVHIAEGRRWYVQRIGFRLPPPLPESELLAATTLRPGAPYRRAAREADRAAILAVLARHAYVDARLVQDVSAAGESVRVEYAVEPGPAARFGRITIAGTPRTRPGVIVRELQFDSGDPLTSERVAESAAALIATGLFESVHIGPLLGQEGDPVKDVHVVLVEKPPGEASLGAGWASTDHARLRVQLQHSNLFGTGRRLGLDLRLAERRRVAEASATQPWLLGTRTALDVLAEYSWAYEPGFTVEGVRGGIGLRRGLGRRWSVESGYQARRTHLLEVRAAAGALPRRNRVGKLVLGAARDTRDDIFDSRRGSLTRLELALAHARLGGGEPYAGATFGWRRVSPLGRGVRLAAALQHASIWLQCAGDELPLEERLYAGGSGSARGFRRHGVGPSDAAGRALGGNHRSEAAVEVRVAMRRRLEAVLFADAAQLVRRARALRLDGYAAAAGFGARWRSSFGLLRADVGFPLTTLGADGVQLDAGVGQSF
jgi:outer membrane protein insertion porin family